MHDYNRLSMVKIALFRESEGEDSKLSLRVGRTGEVWAKKKSHHSDATFFNYNPMNISI